jgi:hypothetical protein
MYNTDKVFVYRIILFFFNNNATIEVPINGAVR